MPPVRIGTRGSPLALAQAHEVRGRLVEAFAHLAEPGAVEIVVISTTGDRILDRTLAAAGGKGLFTKEIEEALQDGRIDLAVHSMKDVPTRLPEGMEIAALLPREDPRDVLISRCGGGLDDLPAGAVVGTAGLRRQAQVLERRPDLRVVPLRGNVQTRLSRMAAGEVDATLLALAGLRRLGLTDPIAPTLAVGVLEVEEMLPAVAQGAIGIEIRSADSATRRLVERLDCVDTACRVTAERAFLAALDGSCRTPIAGLAVLEDGQLTLSGKVLSPDGRTGFAIRRSAPRSDAARLGTEAGMEIAARLPPGFLCV
ncbi:hydroxymethylbilane synthase [Azospirillum thermophilum]|uniref:Porphobilinogen deaminase n=1 Tax=Azospirillum thermophilum TaxID=2202148 RepID=A0A2S2CUQ0_9PROT|nr:hydroxymethylbilane synthase [Azospirillum thermophilum]AWK88216.1 hydroxymethylbilane synthase [Azospirillum thermophilum]